MDAGAFSDERVVKASKGFVRIMVRSRKGGPNQGVYAQRFKQRGFPTVIYLTSDQVEMERMDSRKAELLASQMQRLSKKWKPKHSLKPPTDWIRERLAQLSNDKIDVRARAYRELKELKRALDYVLKLAAKSDDPETRAKIREMLKLEKKR